MANQQERIILFPANSGVNKKGHLAIAGCDVVELAAEFGTPLYVYDEAGIRAKCAEYISEFQSRYMNTKVIYSCKAFINRAMVKLMLEEGMGLDVVSGGEVEIVKAAGFPMDKVYFPGNNKSPAELSLAMDAGVGRIVVDNLHELKILSEIAASKGKRQGILLRITPGVDPHTHHYITTGNIDSKFGVPMALAEKAVADAVAASSLNLIGLHFHIGSQITEAEPYQQSIDFIIGFAADMKKKYGFIMSELSVGGGYAIQYTLEAPAPPVSYFAEAITSRLISKCKEAGLINPTLIIEPGRSIVGRAGVALYTAGVVKDIPGVRRYVSVDGGMADNIRPALYQAKQVAVIANKMNESLDKQVTIAGKYCESGDILITDINLPSVAAGDILAVAGCGAYCVPEAMNYNGSFKPAIVMIKGGKARLVRRRETVEDLMRCDVV